MPLEAFYFPQRCCKAKKCEGLLTESPPGLFPKPQATITIDLQALFHLYIKLNLLPKKVDIS